MTMPIAATLAPSAGDEIVTEASAASTAPETPSAQVSSIILSLFMTNSFDCGAAACGADRGSVSGRQRSVNETQSQAVMVPAAGIGRLLWQYHLGRQLQSAGATHKPAVIETQEPAACRATGPVKRVGKVEPATMQMGRIVDGFPPLHRDMP